MAKPAPTPAAPPATPAAAPAAAPQIIFTPEAAKALGEAIAGQLAPGIRHGETIAQVRNGGGLEPEGGEFNQSDRLARRNRHGKMLMYRVSFQPRTDTKYNSFSGVINDYRYAVQRGVIVEVPWFVVDFWRGNREPRFFQSKDEAGNNIVVAQDGAAEHLAVCQPVDPLPGFVDGEHVDVTTARWAAFVAEQEKAEKAAA